MGVVARVFGVKPTVIPRTLADFGEYLAALVTAPARDVADAILRASVPGPLRAAVPAHRLATAAFLPERLRGEYGLGWSSAHAAALEFSAQPLRLAAMALLRAAERAAPSPSRERPPPCEARTNQESGFGGRARRLGRSARRRQAARAPSEP